MTQVQGINLKVFFFLKSPIAFNNKRNKKISICSPTPTIFLFCIQCATYSSGYFIVATQKMSANFEKCKYTKKH